MSKLSVISCFVGAAMVCAPCRSFGGGGFYQSLYSGGQDVSTGDPMTDGILVDAAGLTFSGNSYTVGETTYKVGDNTTAAYKAYWKMTAGTTYRFVKSYDDAARIKITDPDGTTTEVLHNTSYFQVAYGSYTPTVTGWHTLELRVGNGSGGVGAYGSPFNDAAKLGAGVAWTTADVADCTESNYAQWNRFENTDGESPIFRVSLAEIAMSAIYDAANKSADVSVTLTEISSKTVRVTVDYPTANGDETLVLAESATASETPLTAQIPLVAGATSRLIIRVTDGDSDVDSADFCVYAGDISIAAGGDADINTGTKGTLVISRGTSDAATAEPLTVNYTVGGTAQEGVDYVKLSGSATIPAGESSVAVSVTPGMNLDSDGTETLAITLAEGLYGISSASATATIGFATLAEGWIYDAAAGTMSGYGWVLGVKADTARLANGLSVTSVAFQAESATVLNFAKPALDATGGEFTVVKVENAVFKGNTKLTELYLPDGFYSFYNDSFRDCTSLRKVEPLFPDSVENFGGNAFENCPIEGDIRVGFGSRNVNFGGNYSISKTKCTSMTFGPGCKNLGSWSFSGNTSLIQITLSDQLTGIGSGVFDNCPAVTNITPCLPKSLTDLGGYAFRDLKSCRGTLEVGTGDNSLSLWNGVFQGSGFDEVVIGEKVNRTVSSYYAFSDMSNLRRIRILGDAGFDFNPQYGCFPNNPYAMIVEVPNPADNASWKTVLEDPEQVTPWADLDDETKAKFHENFPGEKNPKGLIIADWSSTGKTGPYNTLVNRWITYQNKPGFTIRLR